MIRRSRTCPQACAVPVVVARCGVDASEPRSITVTHLAKSLSLFVLGWACVIAYAGV